ncbi:cupin [Nisaea sp.]|uniref:cupin n=1 Tax=Nisaea sp. TaxID=2024842 RepID=UPI0032649245
MMARIMKHYNARDFRPSKAWQALDIEIIENASVRLHWTDRAYKWHVNDGPEVFVVLDGQVDMKYLDGTEIRSIRLMPGDIFHAEVGDEHVAEPIGEARILVIEQHGSV